MDEKGISEPDLCRLYGFKHSTVNGWKNDDKDPSHGQIIKFCKCIGINVSDFYSEKSFKTAQDSARDDMTYDKCVALIRSEHKQKIAIPFLQYVIRS